MSHTVLGPKTTLPTGGWLRCWRQQRTWSYRPPDRKALRRGRKNTVAPRSNSRQSWALGLHIQLSFLPYSLLYRGGERCQFQTQLLQLPVLKGSLYSNVTLPLEFSKELESGLHRVIALWEVIYATSSSQRLEVPGP